MSDVEGHDQGQAEVNTMKDFRPRLKHPIYYYMVSFAIMSAAGFYLILSFFGLSDPIAVIGAILWFALCLANDLFHWKKQGGGSVWKIEEGE